MESPQNAQVEVEYTFRELPGEFVVDLPQRVEAAVSQLIRRDRIPSDDDVRNLVVPDAVSDTDTTTTATVRMLLPHSVAVDVAMDRSFNEGGNRVQEAELTPRDIYVLTRRSRFMRLARLRRFNRRASLPTAFVESPNDDCVVCMEPVRYRATRIILECDHVFHRDCIVDWLKRTPRKCPSCRQSVDLTARPGEITPRPRTRSSGLESESEVLF